MSALALASLAVLAAAQPDATALARAAAKEARLAYDTGDFGKALEKYEEAYRLKPVPALQFNLGQCHRQLGHWERAVYFFERFLDAGPPEEQAAEVRPLLEEVKQKLGEQQAREERERQEREAHERGLELERAKANSAHAQAEAAAKEAEEARRKAELEEALRRPPSEAPAPIYKRPVFWGVVAGVVVAAAAVSVGVYVGTAPKPSPTTFPDIDAR
jgi:tetratricopeptide (TPR) repeat protein